MSNYSYIREGTNTGLEYWTIGMEYWITGMEYWTVVFTHVLVN